MVSPQNLLSKLKYSEIETLLQTNFRSVGIDLYVEI